MRFTDPLKRSALRPRWQAAQIRFALVLGVLLGTGSAAWAVAVSAPARPSMLIVPFDLFDFSLDQRPATVHALNKWVRELPDWIGRDLRHGGRLQLIDAGGVRADLQKLSGAYAHPTTCPSCMLELGKHAGVDYVLVGQVRKLSNLITYFQVQVDDVRTGQTVYRIASRADGANSNAMWRRIAHSLAGKLEHSDALAGSRQTRQGSSDR